jgi:nitroimidazol reductase NimA-like FMN-containing flavoprotein (pyridoxamine 5'-phosphate oxidase superfamily)
VVPISYAYDGTYIYAHSEEGMKLKMMRKNPAVCFEVEDMDNMANWKSVIAWGNFEELASEARVEAIKKLLERTFPIIPSRTLKLSSQWPYMPQNFDEIGGIFYRIKLHTKTGRYENSLS